MCDTTLTSVSKAATRQGTHPGGFQSTTRLSLSTVTVLARRYESTCERVRQSHSSERGEGEKVTLVAGNCPPYPTPFGGLYTC